MSYGKGIAFDFGNLKKAKSKIIERLYFRSEKIKDGRLKIKITVGFGKKMELFLLLEILKRRVSKMRLNLWRCGAEKGEILGASVNLYFETGKKKRGKMKKEEKIPFFFF